MTLGPNDESGRARQGMRLVSPRRGNLETGMPKPKPGEPRILSMATSRLVQPIEGRLKVIRKSDQLIVLRERESHSQGEGADSST